MAQQDGSVVSTAEDPKSSSDYIQFKCTPPGGDLNRWSTVLTRGHDYPGAQVGHLSSLLPPLSNGASFVSRCHTRVVLMVSYETKRPCCTAPVCLTET